MRSDYLNLDFSNLYEFSKICLAGEIKESRMHFQYWFNAICERSLKLKIFGFFRLKLNGRGPEIDCVKDLGFKEVTLGPLEGDNDGREI
uniref:Uncharacterized protein n=1 Tax=Lactuca sativa TaxID=4236 RepID=A0A9R1W3Q7_LACSA|nr:hypothetical protein LSAT_V11C300144530 [Lactuca sativa]